jgi:dTDP-4-amino-4,6-dideoxygalactose transaminase
MDPATAEALRQIRQYGWTDGRISVRKGVNSRLDELQAAVLHVKLRHLDEWNAQRRAFAHSYSNRLGGGDLILPMEPDYASHVYHQYVIRHPRRDRLQSFLREQGVETTIHYPLPIHLQPAFRDLGYNIGDLPATERASAEVLSLPLYPGMPEEHINRITDIISKFPVD